ncbi:hypothetical protein ACIPWL_10070 [Streptomyces sp. NPDC090023]|uniref:hypothetical protein n=1 Tax=unclassified Streptomyces TaxID=2593676 RepID=UPI003821C6DA
MDPQVPRVVFHPDVPQVDRAAILAARPERLKFTTDTAPPRVSRLRESLRERRLVARDEFARVEVLHRQHGKYLPPRQLVHEVRPLLIRLQQASDVISGTRVHREGVLDRTRDRTVLPAQEWETAEALAQYSRAARELYALAPQSPQAAAELDRKRTQLAATLASVEARVAALEAYAAKATEADSLYIALAERRAVAGIQQQEAVLDLTARGAADAIAVDDITAMELAAAAAVEGLRQALAVADGGADT